MGDTVHGNKYDLGGQFPGAQIFIESEVHFDAPAAPVYQPPEPPPPGQLPAPGDLPPASRLGYERNPLFTGREGELAELARRLLYDPAGAPAVISTAAGGMGKTQLAGRLRRLPPAHPAARQEHRPAAGVHPGQPPGAPRP